MKKIERGRERERKREKKREEEKDTHKKNREKVSKTKLMKRSSEREGYTE